MALRLFSLTFDAIDPVAVATFWAGMLDRDVVIEADGALVPRNDTQVGLRFVAAPTEQAGPNRLHLHLTSSSLDDQQQTVDRALRLGGRHIDVGQLPEEEHVVLADPEGNAFCVIEPGNNFLAGSGFFGEVTCEGTHEVGVFWSEALGWPLVWDKGEQTALQSPLGGTKLSWDGEGMAPKRVRNRHRFDLVANDVAAEMRRLISLGATELGAHDGTAEMADPDGNEFSVAG